MTLKNAAAGPRPWVNIIVVLVSTYIAIALWALLLNELSDRATIVNEFAPWALVLAIVLLAVVMHLLHRQHRLPSNGEKN